MTSKNLQDPILARLNQSIQKVIQKQILDNEPPELACAIKRLQEQGLQEQEIHSILAKLVVKHFQNLVEDKFSYQKYKEDLKKILEFKNYSE